MAKLQMADKGGLCPY
ncbi:Protein of unknown function [Lactobacillus delbrueckii subsp. bulgaricus]|nr:Protein of unknown function [Lactobacillus delbrueckii subsp. bulgaricus]